MTDPAATATGPSPGPANIPTHAELFLAFFWVTVAGFGGALPWTRRMFVEQKRWMTAEEFNEIYALCQFLPGPNIVNLSALFGNRMRGWSGGVAAWLGFLTFPVLLMIVAGMLYARFGEVDALRRALGGLAAAGAGLLVATAVKMALPLFRSVTPAPVIALAMVGAIGVMRWPLVAVLAVLLPVSVALSWWERR